MNIEIYDTDTTITYPVVFKCKIKVIRDKNNWGKNTFIFKGSEYKKITANINYGYYSEQINGLNIPEASYMKFKVIVPFASGNDGEVEEVFIHTSAGNVIGRSWTSYSGEVSINYRPVDGKVFRFDDISITIDEKENIGSGYYELFGIIGIDNIEITNITLIDQSKLSNPKSIFGIGDSFKIKVDNINFPGTYSKNMSSYGYFINLYNCIDITMSRVSANRLVVDYWSMYGANKVKKMAITDSQFYRYDNHSFVQDVYSNNVISRGSDLSGNGFRIMENCSFIFTKEESGYLLYLRGEANGNNNNFFKGDIHINNCKIYGDVKDFSIFRSEKISNSCLYGDVFENLTIKNLSFDNGFTGFKIFYDTNAKRKLFKKLQIIDCHWSNIWCKGISTTPDCFIGDDNFEISLKNVTFRKPYGYNDLISNSRYCAAFFGDFKGLKFNIDGCNYVTPYIELSKYLVVKNSIMSGCICNKTDECFFSSSVLQDPTIQTVSFGRGLSRITSFGCEVAGNYYYDENTTGAAVEVITTKNKNDSAFKFYGKLFFDPDDAKEAMPYNIYYIKQQ
ncbi:hypothetical protein ID854_17120 [Xenorhabdus sp. M]|uniref:Uncharacterized protein n=1 Tax=Xenorhabdus szentirmaii TaxID=290112 RepID=A0AAW3YXL4_9GAMM|nr:hypothetical protein [Xenorhabdus sp. M]MBD2802111.1 hypothetical protein [Xenorhabdus sp. M]